MRVTWVALGLVGASSWFCPSRSKCDEISPVDLIVRKLELHSKKMEGKVLDMTWIYSGKEQSGQYEGAEKEQRRPRLRTRIVASQHYYWSTSDYEWIRPDYCDEVITTFENDLTSIYKLRKKVILEVDVLCDAPVVKHDLEVLTQVTPLVVWRLGEYHQTPQKFIEELKSYEYLDPTGSEPGDIRLRKFITRKNNSRATYEKTLRFSEMDDTLVYRGYVSRSMSPQKDGGDEYFDIAITECSYDYRRVQDFLIPTSVQIVQTSVPTGADGSPYKHYLPVEGRRVTWTLEQCKILDQFPTELLKMTVPSTARVTDHCRSQAERVVQREARQPAWTRGHWLMVGVALCVLGSGMWCYRRFRR